VVHQIKTIKLVELNFIFKENALFERKSKANFFFFFIPLTLIMQKRDHFRLLRHHYSESPVIPLSNDIWFRCVAHGFITFYFSTAGLQVFNASFYSHSVILCWPVLLVEETVAPREHHWHYPSHRQSLSHKVVSSTDINNDRNTLKISNLPYDYSHDGKK
jgi:hypothetical protein